MTKDALNRLITEAMGECWHEYIYSHPLRCGKCRKIVSLTEERPDWTSDAQFAPLIRWLKGEHPAREVTCWECGGKGRKRSVDNSDNRVPGYSPPGPPEVVSFEDCPLCHGHGKVRLRGWTLDEFAYANPKVVFEEYCETVDDKHYWGFRPEVLDPLTLVGVIGEWLKTLKEDR
jgi:hypothetical protein